MANNIPMKDSALNVIASKRAAQESGTKSIDPKITKTTTTNPEMGTTTTRTSWSGSSSSAKPGARSAAPAKKSTAPARTSTAPAAKSTTPSRTVTPTSGSREITTFSAPKAAGVVTQKITAPTIDNSKKFVPSTTKEKRIANQVSTYNKEKKEGESFDTYRTRRTSETQEAIKKGPAKKEKWQGVGGNNASKSRSGACLTC